MFFIYIYIYINSVQIHIWYRCDIKVNRLNNVGDEAYKSIFVLPLLHICSNNMNLHKYTKMHTVTQTFINITL